MGRTPRVDCNMHTQAPTSPHENYTREYKKKKKPIKPKNMIV